MTFTLRLNIMTYTLRLSIMTYTLRLNITTYTRMLNIMTYILRLNIILLPLLYHQIFLHCVSNASSMIFKCAMMYFFVDLVYFHWNCSGGVLFLFYLIMSLWVELFWVDFFSVDLHCVLVPFTDKLDVWNHIKRLEHLTEVD